MSAAFDVSSRLAQIYLLPIPPDLISIQEIQYVRIRSRIDFYVGHVQILISCSGENGGPGGT